MASCKRCDGSGWIIVERNGVSAAQRCEDCRGAAMTKQRWESANIPPEYATATFDTFTLDRSPNPIEANLLAGPFTVARNFVRDYPMTPKPGLLFIGQMGTGKTHLAAGVLRRLIDKGFDGVFFDYNNLLDRIRASYDPTSASTDRDAYRVALDTEVLLLDDLGAHRAIAWVEDILTSIITHRCNNRKTLIATTNLADPDVGDRIISRGDPGAPPIHATTLADRIGARARSRLFEMCHVIKMPDIEDYRILKKRLEGIPRV